MNKLTREDDRDYERKICSCGTKMIIRPIFMLKGKNNMYGYKACWECLQCGNEIYTHTEFEKLRGRYI